MAKAKGISEAQWQAQVLGLAGFYGWRAYHPPDNTPSANGRRQRVAPGFPDLTLVRGPELIFAELKAENGRLGPGQQEWLDALGVIGDTIRRGSYAGTADEPDPPAVDVYLWRPSDWPTVNARLARGRGMVRPEWAPTE